MDGPRSSVAVRRPLGVAAGEREAGVTSGDDSARKPPTDMPDRRTCWMMAAALAWPAGVLPASAGGAPPPGSDARIPERVVTIAPNAAEIICSLGACERIVGVSKFCVYPPELHDRPRVGGLFDPDLEKIIALRPDLVVVRGRSDAVAHACRDAGIRLYVDPTETLADIERCIRDLGELLGERDRAQGEAERFRVRLEALRERAAKRVRPRVLVTVSRRPGELADVLTTGKGTFLDEVVDHAGGSNVFHDLDMAWPQVSAEAIVAHRPEVIIELVPELELTDGLRRQMLAEWAALGRIPAVTDQRIHFLTDDHVLIPSPRIVEVIEQISAMLHPERRRDW